MSQASLKPKASLKNSIYDEIRRRIVSLDYAPGISLDEKSLVDELGSSRTPVREALIRLSGEGLVDIRKNKGAKVTELDLMTLQSIFEAGDLIERAYTRLACQRRDEEDLSRINSAREQFELDMNNCDVSSMIESNTAFHLCIAAASRNKYFIDCYRRILADHERIAQLWYSHNFKVDDQTTNALLCEQHEQLFQAIAAGDTSAAEKLSVAHATLCKEGIRNILSSGESLLKDCHVQTNPSLH